MFQVADAWKRTYPEARVGVLVMREALNPAQHAGLEHQKSALEKELRSRFSGLDRAALLKDPVLHAYDEYYRRFKKTYHVQLQLESILFKGKSIPNVAALVEAMFMAEMNDLLLTAGHDLDALQLPLTLDVALGTESYILLRGESQILKAGDMLIRDGQGIISSIIYGPDQRTQIRPETRNAIFTTYAPPGIPAEAVRRHLQELRQYVQLVAPQARIELLEVFQAT